MNEERTELQERIEGKLVTKTFNISGMPETVWKNIDKFCKDEYGDSRWTMLQDLIRQVQDDWKYEALFIEIQSLKEQVVQLIENKEVKQEKKSGIKTFGQKKGE